MQRAAFQEFLQHRVDAADLVQVLRQVLAARLHVGEIGRALRHAREIIQRELDARLVSDRRDVQAGVGRAAGRGDRGAGVLQAFSRHQLARQRPALLQDLHRHAAGFARLRAARGIHRRHRRRAGEREAERLRHHRHGVGGELPGTGAQARQADVFEHVELLARHGAGVDAADRFVGVEHGHVLAVQAARQRRAAVHEDRRQVQAQHRHHHAGQRLVAAGEGHQRVVGMAAHHRLDAVGDDFARYQRVAHAGVVHRHRVRDRDRGEIERHATRIAHARAGILCQRAEQRIAGRDAPVGGGHADKRAFDIAVRESQAAQESAVWGAVQAFDRDA